MGIAPHGERLARIRRGFSRLWLVPWALALPLSPWGSSGAESSGAPQGQRSIGAWVSCSGTTDDTAGATKAFAAARNAAFTLLVDCPVRLHSGTAVDRGIFIDNGTTVEFSRRGKFIVDNLFHPAFVIANSRNITLRGWNVEWDNSVPLSGNFGGYELGGKTVSSPGMTQPAAAFNDRVLTPWLSDNRSIAFNETRGWVKSVWVGGVNPAAVFFLTGDTSNVLISGMRLYVPPNAGGDRFIPMAFSSSANWKSNQMVTGKTPETAQYAAVPHGLIFSDIDLDGVLMGWQGNLQDAKFENITSHRYGDLQDASGATVGGIGKWFPPPHLFYLNTHAADPDLNNLRVHFSHIVDAGIRVGAARDKGGGDSVSGYANSLKLGCSDCSIDGYSSRRPDGFMDLLTSSALTVANVTATFDSRFLNDEFPAGLRFPSVSYSNVRFEHVQMTDTAEAPVHGPIGNTTNPSNDGIVLDDFHITMNRWSGSGLPFPSITGTNTNVALNLTLTGRSLEIGYAQQGPLVLTLTGNPATPAAGGAATLTWSTKNAAACSAGDAWSGALATDGTRTVEFGAAGDYVYTLECTSTNPPLSAVTHLRVVAR
jgi:hypothetical protein